MILLNFQIFTLVRKKYNTIFVHSDLKCSFIKFSINTYIWKYSMFQETKITKLVFAKLSFMSKFAFFGILIRESFFSFQLQISLFNSFTVICSGLYFLGVHQWGTPCFKVTWVSKHNSSRLPKKKFLLRKYSWKYY